MPFQSQADEHANEQPSPDSVPSVFVPIDATELTSGSTSSLVEGAPVSVPGSSLRAILPIDVDHDGDRDAIFVAVDALGEAKLMSTTREAASFGAPSILSAFPTPTSGCTVSRYVLRHFSPHFAIANAIETCPEGTAPALASYFVINAVAPVNVRERFSIAASATSTDRAELAIRAEDKDGDSNEDLLVDVQVIPEGLPESPALTLTYFDRPSGLARDTHEPEATLLRMMAETRARAHRNDAAFAYAMARRVLAVHGLICRESNVARFMIGDSQGVSCGASAAAGSAIAIVIKELVRTRDIAGALAATERLREGAYTLSRPDRAAVDAAMAGLASDEAVRLTTGPVRMVSYPNEPHLSPLGFGADGRTVLMRGVSPLVYDIESGTTSPADPSAEDLRIYDVSHGFSVRDVHRTCDGYVLGIVRGDGMASAQMNEALIAAAPPPAGSSCPLSQAQRHSTGDFVVMGWAPQGVVVMRDGNIYVVPIGEEGTPLGAASMLTPGTPAPAPLTASSITSSGNAFVTASSIGFFIHVLAPSPRTIFLRPQEWTELDGEVQGVALSEDLMRIAFLKGGKLYVLSREIAPLSN